MKEHKNERDRAREEARALARTYRNFLAETSREDLTEEYLDEREEGFIKAVEALIEQEKMKRLAKKSPHYQVGGDHYLKMNPQPIELLRSWLAPDEYAGFLRGNIIKYLARYKEKGGVRDLEKAKQYLDWLIEHETGENQ